MAKDEATQDNIANTAIDPKPVLVETSSNTVNDRNSEQSSESQHVYAQPVVTSPPIMAVLPLNSSAKLDQEPNPFEQSFSSASKSSPGSEKIKLPPANNNTTTTTAPPSSTTTSSGSISSTNSIHNMTVASIASTNESLKLPPVAAMTSPSCATVMSSVPKDIASQYAWDSLRAGPLSPSMLQRPNNPEDYSSINPSSSLLSYQEYPSNPYQVKTESYYPHERSQAATTKYESKQIPPPPQPFEKSTKRYVISKNNTTNNTFPNPTNTTNGVKTTSPASPVSPSQRRKLHLDDDIDKNDGRKNGNGDDDIGDSGEKAVKRARTGEEDEKRKNFLERNRLAALKCRQRKKQWLNNLQAKVEYLTNDNEQLQIQTNSLREEIMNLKTILLAHKDCPVSQTNNNSNSGLPTSVNSKTMATQHQQQPLSSLLHTAGGTNGTSMASTVSTATTSPATMAPMYAPRSLNNRSSPHQQQQQHQHRLSTSSTGSQPPSGSLNMVMVSQHQVTAPQSSTVSSSSGVMQF